jgi:hypothetical protein
MPSRPVSRFDRAARLCVASALLATVPSGPLGAAATTSGPAAGGGGTVELDPPARPETRRVWRRLVFTCRFPGLVVFSDLPCGPLPVVHEVKGHAPPEPVKAGASSTVLPPKPAASTRPAPVDASSDAGVDEAARQETACRRLQDRLHALDDRMRAGYSARESATLWARWREARERLREADC